MAHGEPKHLGRQLKQFYVTAGLGIAYENDFSAEICNV